MYYPENNADMPDGTGLIYPTQAVLTGHEARLTAGEASDIYVRTLKTSSEAPR